jgi:hypothetical protein
LPINVNIEMALFVIFMVCIKNIWNLIKQIYLRK